MAALALAVAGCGDDDDDAADPTTPTSAAVTETTTADTSTATSAATTGADTAGADTTSVAGETSPDGDVTVGLGDTDLGRVLVDGEGKTLYIFTPDGQGPSTCTDDCLANWPALAGPATAGDGVDAELLGTAERPDGRPDQVTYDGRPLYYFAADLAAGDTSGQGLGDVWFVVDASGAPIEEG